MLLSLSEGCDDQVFVENALAERLAISFALTDGRKIYCVVGSRLPPEEEGVALYDLLIDPELSQAE